MKQACPNCEVEFEVHTPELTIYLGAPMLNHASVTHQACSYTWPVFLEPEEVIELANAGTKFQIQAYATESIVAVWSYWVERLKQNDPAIAKLAEGFERLGHEAAS